ncbi:hypothetical protein O181_082257 [Austropuccinia psidii MF-1]|uniref:Uncharacterized protein n=1 Tax=Austropuccinia psidii MF-1 TaxID=1389203 RepID=A0A9Q3FQ36_9BASI|nr:hypothetical protein [Austropuccinia psidii MF-1]
MLTHLHSPLDVTPTLPPHHSLHFHTCAAYNPYTPASPSTLLMPPHTRLILFTNYHPYALAVSSQHAFNAAPHLHHHHSLHIHTPRRSRGALKIYLLCCLLFANYHPYALAASSQHASTTHHTYTPVAPSRYTSYTTLNPPYASSSLPITILMILQCPPNMPPTLPPISTLITPYASPPPLLPQRPQPSLCLLPPTSSSLPITILMLLKCPPNMPPTLLPHQLNPQHHLPSLHSQDETKMPPHLCPHHSHTPAAYNPCVPEVPSRYASETALNPPYA